MQREAGIYVEIQIRSTVDEIWRFTQAPEIHERWDLRFSEIRYLPRLSDREPQQFLYSTRIGMGLKIDGRGESTGDREDGGIRISALKFWSADPKSLIEEGSGYWRYVPVDGATRFLTWYDYRTRFGFAGAVIDRLVFRPLIGWATAWSFDCLRLWIEDGIPARASVRLSAVHALARLGIAFTWLWHGLVPKLLFAQADEHAMLAASGAPPWLLPWIGAAEIAMALTALGSWRWRPFFLLNILAMIAALLPVALWSPEYLVAAFNPVTLNAGMIVLSAAGYVAAEGLPSAARCLRRPPRENE